MQIYNTPDRRKEEFIPARPGRVHIYVCGITAYDYCHIGHARSAVVFDVLVRHLRNLGLEVLYVRNFTDIDDKIIRRANEEKRDWKEVAQTYIHAFHEDMDKLGVLRADLEPRATENVDAIIAMCKKLVDLGKAYATPNGDVYFRVRSGEHYGSLSGRSLDELMAGARVQPGEQKEDPLDFALWKSAKPGEPEWEMCIRDSIRDIAVVKHGRLVVGLAENGRVIAVQQFGKLRQVKRHRHSYLEKRLVFALMEISLVDLGGINQEMRAVFQNFGHDCPYPGHDVQAQLSVVIAPHNACNAPGIAFIAKTQAHLHTPGGFGAFLADGQHLIPAIRKDSVARRLHNSFFGAGA